MGLDQEAAMDLVEMGRRMWWAMVHMPIDTPEQHWD